MKKNTNGFSLVEVLMGVALFAVLMVTMSITLVNNLKSARRSDATNVVKNEGSALMGMISRDIEFSEDITSPVCSDPGTNANSLTLTRWNEDDNQFDTIIYSLSGEKIRRKLNSDGVVDISSSKMKFTNHTDCASMFSCGDRFVTICFSGDTVGGSDLTDSAADSGGMKFYNRVIRRNKI